MLRTLYETDELAVAWTTAERAAARALHAWNETAGVEAYAAYRAAADQADAAQDELARRARGRR